MAITDILNSYSKKSKVNQDNNTASQIYNSTLNAKYGTQQYAQNQYAQTQMNNADNYNQNVQTAIDLYKQNMAQQDVARQQAEQYANIGLKAQGISGTGASESTLAGIQNAYMGNINQANANLANNIAAYNQQYDNDQLAARQQYNQDMAGVQEQQAYDTSNALNNLLSLPQTEAEFDQMLNELKAEYGENAFDSAVSKYQLQERRNQLKISDEITTNEQNKIIDLASKYNLPMTKNALGKDVIANPINSELFFAEFPQLSEISSKLKDGDIIKADFTEKNWRGKGDGWDWAKANIVPGASNKEYYIYINGNFYALNEGTKYEPTYKIRNNGKVIKR